LLLQLHIEALLGKLQSAGLKHGYGGEAGGGSAAATKATAAGNMWEELAGEEAVAAAVTGEEPRPIEHAPPLAAAGGGGGGGGAGAGGGGAGSAGGGSLESISLDLAEYAALSQAVQAKQSSLRKRSLHLRGAFSAAVELAARREEAHAAVRRKDAERLAFVKRKLAVYSNKGAAPAGGKGKGKGGRGPGLGR
jgi:hypothetical protein